MLFSAPSKQPTFRTGTLVHQSAFFIWRSDRITRKNAALRRPLHDQSSQSLEQRGINETFARSATELDH
jgi:hypothetical protein